MFNPLDLVITIGICSVIPILMIIVITIRPRISSFSGDRSRVPSGGNNEIRFPCPWQRQILVLVTPGALGRKLRVLYSKCDERTPHKVEDAVQWNEIQSLANPNDDLRLSPPGRECRRERWDPGSRRSQWELTNLTWSLSVGAGWKTFAGANHHNHHTSFSRQFFALEPVLRPWLLFLKYFVDSSGTWSSTMITSMWWKCDWGPPLPRYL